MEHKLLNFMAMRIMVLKGNRSLRRPERAAEDPMRENYRLLQKILKQNRNTEYGRLHQFGSINSLADFQRNVPVSEYEDYAPYIERMKNGETNVLTSSRLLGFSRTSGSSGVPKYIPATSASLQAYVRYTWTRALALGVQELRRTVGIKNENGTLAVQTYRLVRKAHGYYDAYRIYGNNDIVGLLLRPWRALVKLLRSLFQKIGG